MSSSQISSALAQASVIPFPSSDGRINTFINVGLSPLFQTSLTTGKSRAIHAVNDVENRAQVWEKYRKSLENTPFCTDQILSAVGLKPLETYNTMGGFKKNLAITPPPVGSMLVPELVEALKLAKCPNVWGFGQLQEQKTGTGNYVRFK